MMTDGLKLICPICEVEFITNHSQKIYCDERCRHKHNRIRFQVGENGRKQRWLKDERMEYNFEKDKFYFIALKPKTRT